MQHVLHCAFTMEIASHWRWPVASLVEAIAGAAVRAGQLRLRAAAGLGIGRPCDIENRLQIPLSGPTPFFFRNSTIGGRRGDLPPIHVESVTGDASRGRRATMHHPTPHRCMRHDLRTTWRDATTHGGAYLSAQTPLPLGAVLDRL